VGLSTLAPGDERCEYGVEEEFVYIINVVLIAVMIYYLNLKVCIHFVFEREHSVHLPEGPVGSCSTGEQLLFIGAFAKLRKVAISFVMSACLSVHPSVHMQQLGSHWTDFREVLCLLMFENLLGKLSFHKSDINNGYLT
jgi:hypothetical protein